MSLIIIVLRPSFALTEIFEPNAFGVLYLNVNNQLIYRYLISGQFVVNSFLEAQGFPKSIHLNMQRPQESLTALINYVLNKYLDMDTDVSGYVKPAVEYIKVTLSPNNILTLSSQ